MFSIPVVGPAKVPAPIEALAEVCEEPIWHKGSRCEAGFNFYHRTELADLLKQPVRDWAKIRVHFDALRGRAEGSLLRLLNAIQKRLPELRQGASQ